MSDPRKSQAPDADLRRQAGRFCKARTIRARVLAEDYVELVSDLLVAEGEARTSEIARRLGVAQATATKTVARLQREGLVTSRAYRGVFLTESGEVLADRVRIRHRLVVALLIALGVSRDTAEADAEGIEHYVSKETLAVIARFLQEHGGAE